MICFEISGCLFLALALLRILLPCIFFLSRNAGFPRRNHESGEWVFVFFSFLFWSVDLGFYGNFIWGFDGFLFGMNGVLGPWRQGRQAKRASSGKISLPFLGIFLDQGDVLL